MEVSAAAFGGGLVAGQAAPFVANVTGIATPAEGVGQLVWQTNTLTLWFDADGSGPEAAVVVASSKARRARYRASRPRRSGSLHSARPRLPQSGVAVLGKGADACSCMFTPRHAWPTGGGTPRRSRWNAEGEKVPRKVAWTNVRAGDSRGAVGVIPR
jgi:hypothetical protein